MHPHPLLAGRIVIGTNMGVFVLDIGSCFSEAAVLMRPPLALRKSLVVGIQQLRSGVVASLRDVDAASSASGAPSDLAVARMFSFKSHYDGSFLSVAPSGRLVAVIWPHSKSFEVRRCDTGEVLEAGTAVDCAWSWLPHSITGVCVCVYVDHSDLPVLVFLL